MTTARHDALEDDDRTYCLVALSADGHGETTLRDGLSHRAAMALAEAIQREGNHVNVKVMHMIGSDRYEVDRYPLR